MDLFVLILILSRGHHGMQYHLSINMGIKPDPKLPKIGPSEDPISNIHYNAS